MRKILFIICFLVFSFSVFSQQLVWDIASMETLIANHKMQHQHFKQIKENESQIMAFQNQISNKMAQIEYFQSKFYNSLKSVQAIIRSAKDIIYAGDIVNDIVKYQNQMRVLTMRDPKLLLVALQTEAQLVNRTSDLMQYIYQVCIVGTDVNLMDNKQRLNLLTHVIKELRVMRGLAYSVCRVMKTALRNGIIRSLVPGLFSYRRNSNRIAQEILNDYRVISRR